MIPNGRGGGIRTPDPLLPKQMRYQAALRPDDLFDCSAVWFTVGFETAMPVTPSGNRPNHSIQAEAAAGAR